MRSAKLYRYSLPMDSGVILREEKLTVRKGFVVELCENGKTGLGEIAPLKGFSFESPNEAGALAKEHLELWVKGHEFNFQEMFPSVAFGLSMAELELAGGLPEEGEYHAAPLCTGDPDDLIPALNNMPGKKVAKIKVGLYEPVRDGMLVNLFLESMPDLQLRLDANRKWTREQAAKFAQYVAPSRRGRIAYLEEPCASPSDSLAFAIDTGIGIAWDETLQHSVRDDDFRLEQMVGAKAIIIKPTIVGSVGRCKALIEKARSLNIQAVVSSSIESSLALTQLARLSKWLLPDEIPGLDTVGLFKAQLVTPWPGCDIPLQQLEEQELVWSSEQA